MGIPEPMLSRLCSACYLPGNLPDKLEPSLTGLWVFGKATKYASGALFLEAPREPGRRQLCPGRKGPAWLRQCALRNGNVKCVVG